MLDIKSEIASRQTINPSNPTPPHLKTFKLSLLDQIFPAIHVNMNFFYPSHNTSHDFFHKSKLLQHSLSFTRSSDVSVTLPPSIVMTKVLSLWKPKSTSNYLTSSINPS
ncbi:hypothetical protein V6N13_122578 [Hibiscus sabdariffa]|uniref:Uncharacterized protein n=2 Tax=Hibiscus sabdariffa TaxID=183260 RepID=A0ABR2Q7G2_9ROSI